MEIVMGLRVKMNLALISILVVGASAIAFFANSQFNSQASNEALKNAEIIINSAQAVRAYASNQVGPLLTRQGKRSFLPQTVPAHAVKQNIKQLRKQFPQYLYREVSLSPANPLNKASAWEQEVIKSFQDNKTTSKLSGVTNTNAGAMLYLSKPVIVSNQSCLSCHGDISAMPATIKSEYTNFKASGWKLNQIVGAQFVKIPMQVPAEQAWQSTQSFLFWLVVTTLVAGLILIAILNVFVVKRIKLMSRKANAISLGSTDRKSTRLNSSHTDISRMPSSA